MSAPGIIVDVEATPAFRTDEVNATRTMIERVEERFEMKPTRLIGDMAYGAAELLGWMVNDKAIEPHVPVWDKTQQPNSLRCTNIGWAYEAYSLHPRYRGRLATFWWIWC